MAKDRRRKHRKRTKDSVPIAKNSGGPVNYHHILFQRRHWVRPWAKKLREHPYMGRRIPMNTLHAKLHAKVHDIPVPKEPICEATWQELERRRKDGEIDVVHDSLEKRLDFLIEFWGEREGLDATVAMIKWQRQIVHKFYMGGE